MNRVGAWIFAVLVAGNAVHAHARDLACANAPPEATGAYRQRMESLDRSLGIPDSYPRQHDLPLVSRASALVVAGRDIRGRIVRLAPTAAVALQEMITVAESQGVELQVVSGFRSADYQAGLLRDKLRRGMELESALEINAAPGYSEHQGGCAVDLTTPHSTPADAAFADTAAFAWLQQHAAAFGFRLSYPQGNPHGIEFEPWHWRYVAPAQDSQGEAEAATPSPRPAG